MDVQAGLHFCCLQTNENRFSHVKAHMVLTINSACWVIFLCFCSMLSYADILKINFLKKIFQENFQNVKRFAPDLNLRPVSLGLG